LISVSGEIPKDHGFAPPCGSNKELALGHDPNSHNIGMEGTAGSNALATLSVAPHKAGKPTLTTVMPKNSLRRSPFAIGFYLRLLKEMQ
jgi:hypothetical protein